MNLKEETLYVLRIHNKTVDDIRWIGVFTRKTSYQIPVDAFFANADFYYDSGYGCNEISLGLRIVGDGWWLERSEYDGREWWEFKCTPTIPTNVRFADNTVQLQRLICSNVDWDGDDETDDEDDDG